MFIARSRWFVGAVVTTGVYVLATATLLRPSHTLAHENHAPLPTKGVTIAGNNVLLSEKARLAIGLTTAKITFGDLHRTVDVNAKAELPWKQQAMITSLVPGKIEHVLVRPGETVTAGQELGQVASMELESLQLAMLRAASEVDLARRLVDQRKSLDGDGVIAGKSLLEAEASLAQKIADLRIAEVKLRALGIDAESIRAIRGDGQPIRFVPITSPMAGIITHADVRIGQVVKTTDHLYHVVDPARVWIVGEVLESDVRHLDSGQSVVAQFAAYPDRQFPGVIDHVRMKMDRRRRTQSVVIAVDNSAALLRPGMSGRVSISVRVAKEAIVCPADAIIKSRSGRYVLVERSPGKYENRSVQLGLAKGKQVEVLKGVFPGDKVVVTGAYLLASLLGNEHKARSTTRNKVVDESAGTEEPTIAVAEATVELPTDRQAFAGPRIEGRIRRVFVEPSQQVEKGQVLAEVDSLELRTVQLELLQNVSRLRLTNQSLARLEKLGASNITPQRRIWELQNLRDTLLHQVASLERQLSFFGLTDTEISDLRNTDLAETRFATSLLSGVPIRAPTSGWIVGFHVVTGQVVDPSMQLFEIHELSKVWVKGYVLERDAAHVQVGQTAHVSFSAFPDVQAVGTLVRIAPMMEESERVLPVWIEIDNPDRLLKEGMLARVTVIASSGTANSPAAHSAGLRPIEVRE